MSDLIVIQQAAVADHLAELAREGAALRAERVRDHAREHATAPEDALTHPADLPSRRIRLGRWLVTVGEAIAGPAQPVATRRLHTESGHDGPDGLQHAA